MEEGNKRVQNDVMCNLYIIADIKDGGREPSAKQYGQPLEAGKNKETDSLLRSPERNTIVLTP